MELTVGQLDRELHEDIRGNLEVFGLSYVDRQLQLVGCIAVTRCSTVIIGAILATLELIV